MGRLAKLVDAESGQQTNHDDHQALEKSHRRPTQSTPGHNQDARNGRNQSLLQKPELAVPDQLDSGEDRGEQNAHADNARREELDIVALSGSLKNGPEAESQREQKQKRLSQRRDNARARTEVTLDLAQPQNVDRAHERFPRNMRAILRIWSMEPASSSRIVEPVSFRNAFSSVSAPVCSLSSAAVPWATILP